MELLLELVAVMGDLPRIVSNQKKEQSNRHGNISGQTQDRKSYVAEKNGVDERSSLYGIPHIFYMRMRIRIQMTETIPVRLNRETVETIDLFVKTGLYSNRSEAIRELMKRGLDSQEELKRLGKLVKIIQRLDDAGKLNFAGVKLDREFR